MNMILYTALDILEASWDLLLESAPYMIFGLLVGGLLKVFLSPSFVADNLGRGRVGPVFKAAVLGVPLPLCSCGVLPAAASLRRQGANRGAVASFLISTPESGVDSMAVTYALLDPIMTVARPVAAMATAVSAGLAENLIAPPARDRAMAPPDLSCPVDGCCDGTDCAPEEHRRHHTLAQRLTAGTRYAFGELWGDLAGWFLVGLLFAGLVTALVPTEFLAEHLGGGLSSMLVMLVVGVPLYICATASTPIAAALILKGVSPGAALVFLLTGPATNVTSLTVLAGVMGKRATAIYLASIMLFSVIAGLILDQIYQGLGISASAVVGQAGELIPGWVRWPAALALLALSVGPVWTGLRARFGHGPACCGHDHGHAHSHGHNHGHAHAHGDVPGLQAPDQIAPLSCDLGKGG